MLTENYNPDVLSCLANLSSDEVFTSPDVANRVLDLLPSEIWSDPMARFLDPACKSGVFLREITRRLDEGLSSVIQDRQARIDHILTEQVFGFAITELTALLSRRSVYCSKSACGKFSVCTKFETDAGNIYFEKLNHTWDNGKCRFCGANELAYSRNAELETHAYQFIHPDKSTELLEMQFDVIVSNPPYQLSDGGFGRSASPIYHKFVERAKSLNPRFISMIIPSRWFGGGKGLDEFRSSMLEDQRIRSIFDYEDANEIFPGVDIAGGICYFLWSRDEQGPCEVVSIHKGEQISAVRPLNEFKTLIRHSKAAPIIQKVTALGLPSMSDRVSSRKPFGLDTLARPVESGDLLLRWQKGEGLFPRSEIKVGQEMIDRWKVITSYVAYDHAGNPGSDGRKKVFTKIEVLPPGTVCNETYLVVDHFASEPEARNLVQYMKTRFFRFLVSQMMYSQHLTRGAYQFVPQLEMTRPWSDADLNALCSLSESEIEFIESKIREFDRSG